MLKLNGIYKTFNPGTIDENVLFDGLDLEINEGEFVGVIGSNGSGKTTILNIISGDIAPDAGTVILDDEDITKRKNFKRANMISRVFQNPALGTCPSMTIWENLSLADNKTKRYDLSFGLNRKRKQFYQEQLSQLGMGLEDRMETLAGSLSGGQRQALALIMATLVKPKLLLLDEHTAALDPKSSNTVMELTEKVVKEKGITTIMVTHNLVHAVEYGTRTIMMHSGKAILDLSGKDKEDMEIEYLLDIFNGISLERGNSV